MTQLISLPLRRTGCPYPGLRPYRRDESDLFFGRDEYVAQLLGRLHEARFLAVVGTSGCGKSSLVWAGMIPALETYLEVTGGSRLVIVGLRPGDQPLRALARALLRALDPARADDEAAVAFLQSDLRRGPHALLEALRTTPPPEGSHLLFLIDQFEEIFRYREEEDSDEADAFVALLLATAQRADVAAHVVLTMRSDYLGDCAVFTGLPEAISASQFLTPRMTRDQRRKAIEGPARSVGGRVDPDLVSRLLNDMDSGPDQLPLMQHVLMRLWVKAAGEGGTGGGAAEIELMLTDYDTVGGLARALDLHADEAYGGLDPDQQPIAEVLFRQLSERDASTRDVVTRDSRRPTPLGTVAEVAGVAPEDVARVVDAFRAPGLNFLTATPPEPEPLRPATRLDVSHESLIRRWQRLQRWVEAEARSAETYRRLADTARRWNDGRASLYRRRELSEALDWRTRECDNAAWARRYGGDYELAMRFLDESERECLREEKEQEKEKNAKLLRARRITLIALAGFLVALGLMGYAIFQRRLAQTEVNDKNIAYEWASALVRSSRLADVARDALSERNPQLGTLLALEAMKAASVVANDYDVPGFKGSKDALRQTQLDNENALRQALRGIGGRGLCGNRGPINHVAATSDGRRVVTADKDGLLFWDVLDGGEVPQPTPLGGPHGLLSYLVIPPGDRWIVALNGVNKLFLWRLGAGPPATEPQTLPIAGAVRNLLLSFDGQWLLTYSAGAAPGAPKDEARAGFRLWDLRVEHSSATEVDLRLGDVDGVGLVFGWSFDTSGKWLAIVKNGLAPVCWDLTATGEDFQSIALKPGGPGVLKNAYVSGDGRRLVVCLRDGKVRVWELEKPKDAPHDVPLRSTGEEGQVTTLATDYHGRWAVTSVHSAGGQEQKLRLWDLSDPDLVNASFDLGGSVAHQTLYGNIFVSDDKSWLASNTLSGLYLWKLGSKASDRERGGGAEAFIPFSPNGRWLITCGRDWVARSCDLTAPNPLQNSIALRGHDGPFTAFTVSRDGRQLITGGLDATARVWDLDALSPSADPVETHGPAGSLTPATRDHHRLAIAAPDGSVRLWDLAAADPLDGPAILLGPQKGATHISIRFDRDDRWLMARNGDGPARLWDLSAPGRSPRTIDLGEAVEIRPFLVSPDGRWMADPVDLKQEGGGSRPVVRLWDLSSAGAEPSRPTSLKHEQFAVAFVSGGRRLLTVRGAHFTLWDLKAGSSPSGSTPLAGLNLDDVPVPWVTPDGRRLLVVRRMGVVAMWDLESPAAPPVKLSPQKPRPGRGATGIFPFPLCFSPDSRWAMQPASDGQVFVWKLDGSGHSLDDIEPPNLERPDEWKDVTGQDPKGLASQDDLPKPPLSRFSPDGRWLIDEIRGDKVRLLDLTRPDPFGQQAMTLPDRDSLLPPPGSPFTPDGHWLWLETAKPNNLLLWDLRGKEPAAPVTINLESGEQVGSLAVDSTGGWLALVGSDKQLRLWELGPQGPSLRTGLKLEPEFNPRSSLIVGPGGRRVTTVGNTVDNFVARIYRVPLDDLRKVARRVVGRNLTRAEWEKFIPGQDYHKTFESLPEPVPWSAPGETPGR